MSAVCRKCGRPFDEEIRITAGGEKTICDECGASQESESGILTFDTNHVIEIVGGSGAVRERDFQELPGVGMKKRPPERGGATPDKNTPPDSPRPAPKGTAGRNPVEGKKPPPSPVRRPAVEPERECATPDMNDVALDTPVYGVPNVWEYPMKDESASRDESAGDIEAEPARAHATRDKARGLEDEDDEDLAGAAREEEEEHAPAPRGRSVPDSEVEDVADTRNDEEEEEEERAPLPRGRSVPDSEV
ncbi:MAG: hypothetical protein HY720_31665, partial [Planctomycetes bacterium]|nr:hypothetical protein [Planctomycetota bacterium]